MSNLRPNNHRAKNAIILLWIMLAFEVISLGSSYLQYDLLQTAANGGDIGIGEAEANDMRELVVASFGIVFQIIAVVVFIQWFRRAYFNLHLRIPQLAHSEGWAAGAWFVPFANLYLPYQIMKELYQETEQLLTQEGLSLRGRLNTSTIGVWWAFWIVSSIIGRIVFKLTLDAETVDTMITSTTATMISSVIAIPLALLAIKVVKDYAEVEPMLHVLEKEETFEDDIAWDI